MIHSGILNMPYLFSWGGVFALAALDRFVLRRGQFDILEVSDLQKGKGYFSVKFNANSKLRKYRIKYELIDNSHPLSVRYFGDVSSIAAKYGENVEVIQVANPSHLPPVHKMQINIKVSACRTSFFNPFYKICPIRSEFRGVINLV